MKSYFVKSLLVAAAAVGLLAPSFAHAQGRGANKAQLEVFKKHNKFHGGKFTIKSGSVKRPPVLRVAKNKKK